MLLDITMPRMSDVEGIRHLKQRHPGALFVTFTVYDDKRISEAVQMGGCLYLLTSPPPADLLKRLHELGNGAATMSSEVARRVIDLLPDVHQQAPDNFGLTPHETRLLTLLVNGHNFRAIAVVADVKPSTVAWHMQRIYQKLHVHSKSEAVATVLRNGIISWQIPVCRKSRSRNTH